MTRYSPDQAARTLPLTARLDKAPRKRDDRVRRDETRTSLRLLDVAIGSVGLCLTLPLLALISLAIALDRTGPILFRQQRVGRGGRLFPMFKFRTMVLDAERGTGAVWARPEDPRVTRVGAFLRRSHLDELPQLWNVLRGDMSLVGPRPERPEFVQELRKLIPNYMDRCGVPPGITGLAQLRVGYDTSLLTVRRKVRYDRVYIRKRGFRLYVELLVRTAVHCAVQCAGAPRLVRAATVASHGPFRGGGDWPPGPRTSGVAQSSDRRRYNLVGFSPATSHPSAGPAATPPRMHRSPKQPTTFEDDPSIGQRVGR